MHISTLPIILVFNIALALPADILTSQISAGKSTTQTSTIARFSPTLLTQQYQNTSSTTGRPTGMVQADGRYRNTTTTTTTSNPAQSIGNLVNWRPAPSSGQSGSSSDFGAVQEDTAWSFDPASPHSVYNEGTPYEQGPIPQQRPAAGTWSGGGTPTAPGPLDEWFREPVPAEAAATAILAPSVHYSHDKLHIDHVTPCDSRQQYHVPSYADSNTHHQYAWVTTNYTNNAIVLDHSDLYTWIYTATTGNLILRFKDQHVYDHAASTWHPGMIMVFYDGSCGEAMNCYVLCNSLIFDPVSKTCTMATSAVRFEEIAVYFVMSWGEYVPGRRPDSSNDGYGNIPVPSVTTSTSASGSGSTSSTSSGIIPSSSADSGNYPFGFDGDNDNCTAPVDSLYGLPTACLGQYFDQDLDDAYNYTTLAGSRFADFANSLSNLWYDDFEDSQLNADDYSDTGAALGLPPRRLRKRWNPFKFIKKIIKAVVKILPPIPGITRPYNIPIINKLIPLNIPSQRQTVASPWGQQVLIKSLSEKSASGAATGKIDLYCVDCGASGTANLAGSIGVLVLGGIDYVKAEMNMNLAVGLKLGLVADAEYKKEINQPLFTVPLSSLSIGIASIGPYLKAGVELDLNLKARGQILGGGVLSFSNAKVSLEVTTLDGSASGWTPSFDPVFEAEGEISASADFGVPVAIALGITALKWSADVSLVERPAIVARAQASAVANLNGAGFVSVDGCTGISAGLSFKNDVYAQFQVSGITPKKFGLFSLPEKSLVNNCIKLPAAPTTTTTSTVDTTTTSSSASMEESSSTTQEGSTTGTVTTTAVEDVTTTTGDADGTTSASTSTTTDIADGNVDATSTTTTVNEAETAIAKRTSHPFFVRRQTGSTSNSEQDDSSASDPANYIDDTNMELTTNSTTNTSAYVVPDSNEFDYQRTDGYTSSTLIDSTAKVQAYPCSDGNIHIFGIKDNKMLASDCQEDFVMFEDEQFGKVIAADGFHRLFVYYPDEMEKAGVSRIRVVDNENIPTGSEQIVWVAEESDTTEGGSVTVYYPLNQYQDTFYPAMCRYSGGATNKMFLMKDSTAGLTSLMSKDIKYSVTGGDVEACYYLPLIDGKNVDQEGTNGGLFEDVDDVRETGGS